MAASAVCMTSRITVRRDQPNGQSRRSERRGCRSSAAIHLSGRVSLVPGPAAAVKVPLIASPPWP